MVMNVMEAVVTFIEMFSFRVNIVPSSSKSGPTSILAQNTYTSVWVRGKLETTSEDHFARVLDRHIALL